MSAIGVKFCGAFSCSGKMYVESQSALSGTFAPMKDPLGVNQFLDSSVRADVIGKAIRSCMDRSRDLTENEVKKLLERPDVKVRYDEWVTLAKKEFGVKTRSALFKRMVLCHVRLDHGGYTFTPTRHDGGEAYLSQKAATILVAEKVSDEVLGDALRSAFTRCVDAEGNPGGTNLGAKQ